MARPKKRATALLFAGLVSGWVLAGLSACSETGAHGGFRLEIYENTASCDVAAGLCYDADGRELAQQKLVGSALVSRLASTFAREGLLFSTTTPLRDGRIAVLEFDASTYPMPGETPRVYYSEHRGSIQVFRATHITGQITLPPLSECPCSEGRMELEIIDAGEDGIAGTEDDQQRRITRGLISMSGRYCTTGTMLPISETLEVDGMRCLIPNGQPSSRAPDLPPGHYDTDYYGGCHGDYQYYDDTPTDDGGCGGEEPASYGDEGCDGDEFDSGSSSGCESDSSDTACEGSSGGESCDDIDCDADAVAATGRGGKRKKSAGPGTLPFILGALWLTQRRRRHRRPRR